MIFRCARHTQKLDSLVNFYTAVLEFQVLGNFRDHNGYDGVFLGLQNTDWHLEFTQNQTVSESQFDEDDILVFYPENQLQYDKILENIKLHKVPLVSPKNSYWKENGICFEDCDGYKIIVSNLKLKT